MDLINRLAEQAKKEPKKIVFPEGDNPEIAAAVSALAKDGVVKPIVLVPAHHCRLSRGRDPGNAN